jgi:hypothetical protein
MATKRPPDDDPNLVNKIQRIEHADPTSPHQRLSNNDFSGSVKKKLADSKRTGQACDRCKVRTRCAEEKFADALLRHQLGLTKLLDM